MIAFLTICYSLVYLIVFNKLKLLKKSAANISAFVGVGVLLIGSIVFMWYTFAPIANDARLFRFVIPIVPNVKGQVVEVPVKGMQQIVKGDVIYRIDPTPYQHAVNELVAAVDEVNAQKQLAQTQVNRALELVKTQSAAQVDLDQWTADLEVLKASEIRTRAQLANANWQLQETVVRAPNDGYVANLQVRPGTYVSNIVLAAALTFISSEASDVVGSYSQSAIRHIQQGDTADIVFTTAPGNVYPGKVKRVAAASGQAQMTASGQLPSIQGTPLSDRWVVLVDLDDQEFAASLPQGAAGTMAIYTSKGKPVHIISKVVMHMQAWMGFLTTP